MRIFKFLSFVFGWFAFQGKGEEVPSYQSYQKAGNKRLDRKDHIWTSNGVYFKCVLCGGITHQIPPNYPTPKDFVPEKYQPLTQEERDLCPVSHCQ